MRVSRLAFALLTTMLASGGGLSPAMAQEIANASVPQDRYLTVAQLRARYGDPAGKIARIRGMEIYYKDEGSGPVLLMVHGSASSLKTYDVIAEKLKSKYRIVRFDVGGMGLSGSISDEVAAKVTPVEIAKGLLDKLGIKEVTYVGVSSGGTLGMYLAAEHSGMVKRLILSNTPADRLSYGHMVQPQSFYDAQQESRRDGGFQSRHFWDEFFSYFSGEPERFSQEMRDEYYDMNRRTPERHPIALTARIDDGVAANEKMKKVRIPTLLVWGAKDQLLPVAAMNSLERHLENAQVSTVIMPDVGHYPPVEVPERFATVIEAYIEAAVP